MFDTLSCLNLHLLFFKFYLFYVYGWFVCMYVPCLCLVPLELLGGGVTDSFEPPRANWELNPGLLEEQPVL